jgi:hypothetical protein
MDVDLIIKGFFEALPSIVIWITALILSSILVKKGSGQAERLLIVGSILMLVGSMLNIPQEAVESYIVNISSSNIGAARLSSLFGWFLLLIKLAGVIYIFIAVWKKFNKKYS